LLLWRPCRAPRYGQRPQPRADARLLLRRQSVSIRENIVALGYLAVPSGWIVLLAVLAVGHYLGKW
ncbi:hypothetical protein CPZ20_15730, partial [Lacticaseibacillus rhamnosus]